MKKILRSGNISFRVLVTLIVGGAIARAALPYLPLVGPPAMRLQSVKTPVTAVIRYVPPSGKHTSSSLTGANGSQSAAGALEFATIATPPSTTTTASSGPLNGPGAGPDGSFPPVMTSSDDGLTSGTSPSGVFNLPTPNLLSITPQALAAYFRPMKLGTNSAALTGVAPVSFVPPMPTDNSSHASYILK